MKGNEKALTGIITILTVMLVSINRRLPVARRLSSGTTTLALAGIVLLVAAGVASANCIGDDTSAVFGPGSTVTESCTFNANMVCPAGAPGLYVGAAGITIDGAGYKMTGARDATACSAGILYGGAAPPDDDNPAMHSGIANIGNWNNVKITNLAIEEFCTGIALGSVDATDVDYNEVTNCSIYDCGDPAQATQGIHMVRTNYCSIECNGIHDINGSSGAGCSGGGNGIFMYGNQQTTDGWYNSFTCNDLSHNAKSGFFMKHQCKYNYLGNNYAVWNGEGGIVPMCMRSDYNTYDRNNLSYNYKWGFMTRGTGNDVLNNTMIGNGRDGSSPGISISNNGGNVVNDNCVCGSGGMDIAVNGFATCNDNTCDTHDDGANCCPWNCDNLVSDYYDFDEDASYSGLFGPCCNLLDVGAGNNPGLFNESGASTHCDGGFCIYPDPGDDLNDCGGAVEPKPDLTITDKYETWISEEENTYNITYTVCNIGDAPAGESRTRIKIDGVPTPPPGVVPALDVDECFTQTLEGPYTCSCDEDGVDTIELCADGPGWIDESNENNNCLENVWVCNDCYLPDLTITDKYEAWVNETHYNITYTVCNIGLATAGESRTKVMIDGVPTGIPGIVPELAVDECYTSTLPYLIGMSDDEDTIELCADGPDWITESDENNNCLENVFGRYPDLVIDDIKAVRWCCCCIALAEPIRSLKDSGDGGEKLSVMFLDDPELAEELGDEKLREQVAEVLAKDPKQAAEIAVKIADGDVEALAKFTKEPRKLSKLSKAEFADVSKKLISNPELVDRELVARCCCCCSSCFDLFPELADLLDSELTAGQQHDMSDLLDEIVGGCNCDCCCCRGRFIIYNISNVGDGDAGFSLSNLTVNGHVRSVDIVRPLDAGDYRWEIFPCYRMGWWWWYPPREVTVCADAPDWMVESDETNNCRTEWL